jgi:hypothetical protein
MSGDDFLLKSGHWLGLTMFPGYADVPYHSPIKVEGLQWLSGRHFNLQYLNIGYAAGLHDFSQSFEVLRAAHNVVACGETTQLERVHVFSRLTSGWMRACLPQFARDNQFDESGLPIDQAFKALAG